MGQGLRVTLVGRVLLSALGLAVCAMVLLPVPGRALDAADYATLNRALADAVVMPAYRGHADAMATLSEALTGACGQADGALADRVEAAFHRAFDAWQRAQPIRFGPVMQGFGPARIQYWPDRRGTGARQLRRALAAEDAALLDPETLAQASVALRDLQALERLLFDPTPAAVLAAGGYRCAFAAAIARLQARLATDLLAAWQGPDGYRQMVLSADAGNDGYFDAAEAAADFLRSLSGTLDVLIAQKLEPPLGESLAAAQPRRVEQARSRRSMRNITANLETVAALYRTPGGFGDLLARAGAEPLANGMRALFVELVELARAVGPPLSVAVADPATRAQVEALLDKLKTARILVTGPLAQETALVVGFNATDGD